MIFFGGEGAGGILVTRKMEGSPKNGLRKLPFGVSHPLKVENLLG